MIKLSEKVKRSLDGILVTRSVKAPGAAQYCMHELEFQIEIPLDEHTNTSVTQLFEVWEPYFTAFEAKYVRPQIPPQQPATPPPQPEIAFFGIDQIEWHPNKFGPGEYCYTDRGKAIALCNALMAAVKPVQIADMTYSLNAAKTYIYRKKTT